MNIELKKVRCKKELGLWFYYKECANDSYDLDGPIYYLYDEDNNFVCSFGCYGDMLYYIKTGIVL